jgi:hypothetical protein
VSDFFETGVGMARQYKARAPLLARAIDLIHDTGLSLSGALKALRRRSADQPARNILVVGVEVPSRPGDIHRLIAQLTSARHRVTASVAPMGDRGKFVNIDLAIAAAPAPLASFDWVVVTDDDIALRPGFLDDFIAASEAADLAIAQPAHLFDSYVTYGVTQRRWGALARRTRFVEIGPLTALRADTFADLIPFPVSRWGYGIDVLWAAIAQARGWKIGVVDASPISHLRPVGGAYDTEAARDEGRALLAARNVTLARGPLLSAERLALGWRG